MNMKSAGGNEALEVQEKQSTEMTTSDNGGQEEDVLTGGTRSERIRETFEKTLLLMDPVADVLMKTINNEEKLRLYGLYKHIRKGPCNDVAPSIWNIEEYYKHQSHNSRRDMHVDDAMREYVDAVVEITANHSFMHELAASCKTMLKQVDEAPVGDSSSAPVQSRQVIAALPPPRPSWSSQVTSAISSIPRGAGKALSSATGVRPLIPRGQLDISYNDLAYGAIQCTMTGKHSLRPIEQKISKQWTDATSDSARIVTGLAVRSLFDLYLRVQKYPPGSEIIMTPPINVPSMVHVMKHHGIKIVGVDIPGRKSADTNGQTVSVDVDGIEKAITPKTVAIMVVHPFGIISASHDEMKRIRKIADSQEQTVHLLEDCAEVFVGLTTSFSYTGSTFSDVSFFSFGLIKAATALGGGIALIRDAGKHDESSNDVPKNAVLYESMQRFHNLHYEVQTNSEFFSKVMKAVFLRSIADMPLLYALLYTIVTVLFGPKSFDDIVTSLIRGYFNYKNVHDSDKAKSKSSKESASPDISLIRKRPAPALLALLHRRFTQVQVTKNIKMKVDRCEKVTKAILKRKDNDYEIPVANNGLTHYYWIYPILSSNRQATTQHFIKAGFDATHGATQLCCIPGTEENNYPNARDVMDRTVYLPVAGPQFPDDATNNIIRSIEQLPSSSAITTKTPRRPTSSAKIVAKVMPAVVITTAASTWFFNIPLVVVLEFIQSTTLLLSAATATIVVLLWFFRNSSAPIYMDGSHAFSKYSDMLLPRENKSKELVALDQQRPSIMSSMEILKVRDRLSLSKNGDQSVFLTGASGFVGSKILHDLLLNREKLRIGRIIVLCRAKRNVSGNDRIIQMLDDEMFSFLTDDEKTECVEVVEGDVTLENAGISNADLDTLCNHRVISHVIHCAASVSFNQSLPDAAKSNITSTLSLQKLATKFNRGQSRAKTQFVHISTAFVHGGSSGSASDPLPETLFDLGKFDPQEIYKSMVGTQYYASKAYNELGFPNTYTFSKCICEHLLVHFNENMSTLIIRPSIVGPAVEAPYEGWAGKMPTTVVATAALYFSYQWNLWCFGEQRGPVIPVDVLSRYVLVKIFNGPDDDDSAKSEESSDDDYDKVSKDLSPDVSSKDSPDESVCQNCIIHNATWDSESPLSTTFIWREYAMAVLHVGGVMGNFSRAKGLIGLFFTSKLFPSLNLKLETFEKIHRLFVQFPFSVGINVCGFLGHDTSRMKRLQTFLDLPVLFYSFINNTYYFKSELIAPKTLSGERYAFSCVLAAHSFITKLQEHGKVIDQAKKPNNVSNYQVAGPWANQDRSLFWAWTQPRGNFIVRAAGWVLAKVFSSCCSEVTVDLTSFTQVIEVIKGSGTHKRIILAPTHRSFFDFLLVSYVFFCVPELQVDVPFIVAADDFERLPFLGTLARLLRAVFISRDKTNVDPKLKEKLNAVEKRAEGTELYVEVFIEGTRSRDRRFARPKTGVLKCLQQNGGGSLIVPISISYERLPDQSGLCAEADGGFSKGLQASGLVSWLYDVFGGKIDLGKIHLTACAPLEINESRQINFSSLVDEIQMRQQSRVYVSNYHIECTAKLLDMEKSEVRTAFAVLGVPAWPHDEEDCVPPQLPENKSELLTVVLQASPFLAPLFHYSHPSWSKWLNRLSYRKNVSTKSDPTVTALVAKVSKLFDDADLCVDLCHSELLANGFTKPSHQHLLGTAKRMSKGIPNILLSASISIKYPEIALAVSKQSDVAPVRIVRKTKVSDEALGFWGFYDSSFVLRVDRYGKPYVTMEGSRYGFEGKKITKLIPFIEAETELKMDPTNEAFRNAGRVCSDCKLSEHDISLLKGIVASVSLTEEERLRHGTGHCQEDIFAIREGKPIRVPDIVVWPESEEEVEKLVKLAKERNWCLFPYGGGTNVSQATRCPSLEVEPRQIISVDMRKMNRIVSIDEENGLAHIEAGITGRVLEEQLRNQGYTMGHEPDSMEFSTLGGWIATKASGMKRSKYGNIEDIVMSVRVASARGVLQHGKGSGAWGREACGIDLRGLIIGSEGCLGIVTSAVVRISPVAGAKSYDSVLLPDFNAGYEFMHGISRQKTKLPSSVRLLDNEHFRLGLALRPDDSSFLTAMKKTALGLFLKLTGRDFHPKSVVCATISYEGSKEEVREQMEAVSKLAAMHGGVRLGAEVGKAGYSLTFMIAYLRDFAMTYHVLGESFETFVPWSKVKDVIRLTKERIRNEHAARYLPGKPFIGARITQLYHEGACLYFYFCMNFENVDNASHVYSEIEHAARSEILAHGGSLSHHHGLGKVRASYLKDIDSPPLLEAMKSVKQGIDPDNTFGARNGAFASDE